MICLVQEWWPEHQLYHTIDYYYRSVVPRNKSKSSDHGMILVINLSRRNHLIQPELETSRLLIRIMIKHLLAAIICVFIG